MTLENKNLVTNYSSAKFSWLKSGGKISHLYKIYNLSDLKKLFSYHHVKDKSLLVIGNLVHLCKDHSQRDGVRRIQLSL